MSKFNYGRGFNETNSIRIVWAIDDVRVAQKNLPEEYHEIELTDDECMEILENVEDNHCANIGISWTEIESETSDYIEDMMNVD
tara:strand:+ start:174 stop:425 length:252 start_codon:yes stop_codon:yes gene_type:complete